MATTLSLINYSLVSPSTNPSVKVQNLPRTRCPVSMMGLPHSFPKNRAMSKSKSESKSKSTHLTQSPTNTRVFKLYPDLKDDDPPAQLHEVFWYLDDMVAQGYKPDENQANRLLADLCRSKKIEKAARALELMISSGCTRISSRSYNEIVVGLCTNRDFSTAVSLVEKLEDNGFSTNPATYNALLVVPFKSGNFKQGCLIMDWLIQRGFVPTPGTYAILIDATCYKIGVDEAIRLLKFIISEGRSPVSVTNYNTLLKGLCWENRVDEAVRFFKNWPSMGITPNLASYNTFFFAFCLQGRWNEAKELLPERATHFSTARRYNFLVGRLSHHGRTDDALQLIDEMLRKGIKPIPWSYNSIILCLCKEGRVDDVVKCIDQMIYNGCEPKDVTYNAISKLCMVGMVEQAFSIINSLLTRQKLSSSCDFYNTVLFALCKNGNTYPAFQLLYEMTKCGFTPSPYTYSALLTGLCKDGLKNAASQIFQIMEESGYKANLEYYNALISALCVHGNVDLGLEVFCTMIEKGCLPDETLYANIVQGIALKKKKGLASLVLRELYSKRLVGGKLVERLVWENDLEEYFS